MAVWLYTVNASGILHNDALTFEEKRDRMVEALKASTWYAWAGEDSELWSLVEELGDAEDAQEFDWVWDGIYNLADADRAWIETHS